MSAYSLRTISMQDATYQQVYDLREEVLRKPLGQSLKNDDLSNEPNETIIAAINDQDEVIGCVMLRHLSSTEVKLRQMAVATALQGRGIGRALVRQAEEVSAAAGYQTVSLHARQYAVPFYEKLGYQVQGDVFTEVGIPHLFMIKSIR